LTAMRHVFRGNPFGGETVVDLSDDGIDVTDSNGVRHITLGDVARVRLRMIPLRASTNQFICAIEPRVGAPAQICSASYRNPISVEAPAAPWRPPVDDLHRRLARREPPPLFIAGDSPMRFALPIIAWLVLVAAALSAFSRGYSVGLAALLPIGFLGL